MAYRRTFENARPPLPNVKRASCLFGILTHGSLQNKISKVLLLLSRPHHLLVKQIVIFVIPVLILLRLLKCLQHPIVNIDLQVSRLGEVVVLIKGVDDVVVPVEVDLLRFIDDRLELRLYLLQVEILDDVDDQEESGDDDVGCKRWLPGVAHVQHLEHVHQDYDDDEAGPDCVEKRGERFAIGVP